MIPESPVLNRRQTHERDSEFYSREFGDSLNNNSNKSNNVLRYSFQNIRGFGTNAKHERALEIKDFIDKNSIDVFGMAEVNVNWKNLRRVNTMEQICRTWYERTQTMSSYNSHQRLSGYSLPGGVGNIVKGPLVLRVKDSSYDPRYLGRWGSQCFQGKGGVTIRFVSVYVLHVTKEHGDKKYFVNSRKRCSSSKSQGLF